MATVVNFKRIISPADESIGFKPQVDVYMRQRGGSDRHMALTHITTANIGVVDGNLVADFLLEDDAFIEAEEIILSSVIAETAAVASLAGTVLRITGVVIERGVVADMPGSLETVR